MTLGANQSDLNNLLDVSVNVADTTTTITSVVDNASSPNGVAGVYPSALGSIATNGAAGRLFRNYAVQNTAGATSVTANLSASVTARIYVESFAGGATDTTKILGNTSSGQGSSGPMSVTSFAVSSNNLIVAHSFQPGTTPTLTAGTNYTKGITGGGGGVEYRLASSTSETAPFTTTAGSNYGMIAAEYKLLGTTGGTIHSLPVLGAG